MKYWTLFTLRMMLPVALLGVATNWQQSQGRALWVKGHAQTIGFTVLMHDGTSFVCVYRDTSATPPGWVYRSTTDTVTVRTELQRSWTIQRQIVPGAKCRCDATIRGHMLEVDHWLVCLTLFVATVATNRPRKKQTPPQDTEQ